MAGAWASGITTPGGGPDGAGCAGMGDTLEVSGAGVAWGCAGAGGVPDPTDGATAEISPGRILDAPLASEGSSDDNIGANAARNGNPNAARIVVGRSAAK